MSATGKNLNLIIICKYCRHHDWMAFASWYSIYKNLPDANVSIYYDPPEIDELLFTWTDKCKLKVLKNRLDGYFEIEPHVLAVNPYYEDAVGPISVKSNEYYTFVSYLEGCGKFVLSDWINSIRSPFGITSKLYTDDLSLNEYKVLKLWAKCRMAYSALKN